MATICQPRRALMEIPAPQPKISARMRRSYLEILSSRMDPLSATARTRSPSVASRPGQPLDTAPPRPLRGQQEEAWDTAPPRPLSGQQEEAWDTAPPRALRGQQEEAWDTPPPRALRGQQEEAWDTAPPRALRGQREEACVRVEESRAVLSKQQLVELIRSFIIAEQTQRSQSPTSDLKLFQDDLHMKKTNVYRSIPYSRLGSNRDAHCYRKAFPHVVAFKLSCQEGGRALLHAEDWDSAIEHSLVAWRYTSELPQWDTSSHNAVREQCFSTLAAHCVTALQHLRPQPSKARELMRRFKMAQMHSQAILPCVQELQRILGES